MAEIITLNEALQHLREDAGVAEQTVLRCVDGAIRIASNYCNRTFFASEQDMDAAVAAGKGGPSPTVADAAVISAMLLIVGQLYGFREDVVIGAASSATQLPGGARMILFPYRVGLGV